MTRRRAWCLAVAILIVGCAPPRVPTVPPSPGKPSILTFRATAYSIEGRTTSGVPAREGIVAADPAVLPLGSRIRIHDAGPYSGEYVVSDTGTKVRGRGIDIYLRDDAEAKPFGRRRVKVEVLRYGRR